MNTTPANADGDAPEDKAFSGSLASVRWPGRQSLYIKEVALELECTEQHVINLIECGRMGARDISTGLPFEPGKSKLNRQCLRVPVEAWDDFIKRARTR